MVRLRQECAETSSHREREQQRQNAPGPHDVLPHECYALPMAQYCWNRQRAINRNEPTESDRQKIQKHMRRVSYQYHPAGMY